MSSDPDELISIVFQSEHRRPSDRQERCSAFVGGGTMADRTEPQTLSITV
jgi:hypothetical protein